MAKRIIEMSVVPVTGTTRCFAWIIVDINGKRLGDSWFCDSLDHAWSIMARAFEFRVMDANLAGDAFEVKMW
jgi:hypothetical protein